MDLDYILSHFKTDNKEERQPRLWPRTISTKATQGRQVIVNSQQEALAYFKAANYFDCRISAYPYWRPSIVSYFTGIKNAIAPDLIMIDLDRCNFDSDKALELALRKTLKRIKELLLDLIPTVIWSGNGYHIYIPINAVVLEDINEFANIEQVSTKFLRFAEWYLSAGKSDSAHNSTVSLNNCMLRIPGTYNSKNNAQVRIIKKWNNNNRPDIALLLGSFCAYLTDQKLKEERRLHFHQQNIDTPSSPTIEKNIPWIEKLLQTPLTNGRKYCIWRILVPYLVNIKQLPFEQSANIIKDWLDRCAQLRRIDFNANYRIKYALTHLKGYYRPPINPKILQAEYDKLYELLQMQGVFL
jgi:hypothetical protein